MKCKYCGGRDFRLIVRYIQEREYSIKEGDIIDTYL